MKRVKIQYNSGETGWATPITDDLMILDNIPLNLAPPEGLPFLLHYGDVVRVKDESADFPVVKKVVTRRFPVQERITCTESQFRLLAPLVRYLRGHIEGGASPDQDSGTKEKVFTTIVALPCGEYDPVKLAEAVGISQSS